ncbi:probable serine/threonine-protein kinase At1g54610 [Magnolia sinica]|uniref:probable serine/threonine-protein kinase At1g54610 n=1 Tax=Magnolia sinica TaxID=86752 RepID=UPI00265B6333|nr:probable serine/threonine-protein kinase At1g54610 [Magnolia sinica]
MGCILGKHVSSTEPKPPGAAENPGKAEEPSGAVITAVNGVRIRKNREGRRETRSSEFQREHQRRPSSLRNLHVPPVGWPSWLLAVAGDAIDGWAPRRADTFEKLDKIGQGTYSNVYKARDLITGKIVALKKVRFDNLEPESVKFMAREILILRRLDHPNVVKLEGLVTSRMSCSLYLVFEYMEHDLAGLAACPGIEFTEPQVKCYMKQLFSGLEHCHNREVLHRDIKGSNLLLDNHGSLKIADFGLASFYDPDHKQPMTSRVVTLWYRPPELLLGATYYGVGVDLWSAGCILAELLAGKPIMPGRTEVEQLHKIFKLCGSPSDEYWKKSKLPHATIFKPTQPYQRCIAETFKDFPPSSLPLIETLLSIDPAQRGTATAALNSEFFKTEPYACDPSSLPQYPPSKEMDAKLRDEEAKRQRGLSGKGHGGESTKKVRVRDRAARAVPAPEANAELQVNLDRRRLITHANAKSKSEKFPPPHQDGAVGFPMDASHNGLTSFGPSDASFAASIFDMKKVPRVPLSGPLGNQSAAGGPSRKKKTIKEEPHMAPSRTFIRTFKQPSIGISMDLRKDTNNKRVKGKEVVSEVFGSGM